MRFLSLWLLALVVGSSSARAQAVQLVQPADLVGKWKGPVVVEGMTMADSRTGRKSCRESGYGSQTSSPEVGCALKGTGILMLRPDSLWWEWQTTNGWGAIGGGRWRLVGDSLWLAVTPEYSYWATASRQRIATSVADTSGMGLLPKPDPLFWSKVLPAMVYKVVLTGNQLSLFSFDSLAKNPQAAAQGVYTRVSVDSASGRHP